jgi:probable non-F420 flavinoid oxidoreductase
MTQYGFHASHEQFTPSSLLTAVRRAGEAGFRSAMCSDHFAPWSSRQGQSGYAWSWLGSALEATEMPFGVVTSPGQRYHPAVLAQAAATLTEMYPDRFWLALGSGQALNEQITGDRWPPKAARQRRTEACAEIMRALFAGETVTREEPVRVEQARLWTRPDRPPPLLAAAVTPPTARSVARWAEGLITVNQPEDAHHDTLDAYREAGGRGPAILQAHLSWDTSREAALAAAHDQWREVVLGSDAGWELPLPEHFEQIGRFLTPADVAPAVHVSAEPGEHAAWLRRQAEAGFDRIMLHQVGADQLGFIDTFGERVLPEVTS